MLAVVPGYFLKVCFAGIWALTCAPVLHSRVIVDLRPEREVQDPVLAQRGWLDGDDWALLEGREHDDLHAVHVSRCLQGDVVAPGACSQTGRQCHLKASMDVGLRVGRSL